MGIAHNIKKTKTFIISRHITRTDTGIRLSCGFFLERELLFRVDLRFDYFCGLLEILDGFKAGSDLVRGEEI